MRFFFLKTIVLALLTQSSAFAAVESLNSLIETNLHAEQSYHQGYLDQVAKAEIAKEHERKISALRRQEEARKSSVTVILAQH